MKLSELEAEVLSLMYEEAFDDRASLIFAVNRAIAVIHTERDRIIRRTLYIKKRETSLFLENLHHSPGSGLRYSVKGRAFAATVCGNGKLLFTSGGEIKEICFTGGETVIKEIIDTGTADIEFSGDFDYDITALAVYTSLFSSDKEDIEAPLSEKRYDMHALDKEFIAFCQAPCDRYGMYIHGARADGASLILPRDFSGEVKISYKRGQRKIGRDELDCDVDISDECQHLLPWLTASYLLSDDNPELSMQYLALYRDGIAAIKLYNRKSESHEYTDVTGWAR